MYQSYLSKLMHLRKLSHMYIYTCAGKSELMSSLSLSCVYNVHTYAGNLSESRGSLRQLLRAAEADAK